MSTLYGRTKRYVACMMQHCMILFKKDNVFTEMKVLTATERAVQRREVIYNTTGLSPEAQHDRLPQRNAREAAEVAYHASPVYERHSMQAVPA